MINQSLKVFVEVVEQKSFTRAAEILHMTQPAVSGYIKKIEEQLTVNLIDRSGKTIRLSHAGEIYYSYAKEMIVLNDRMENLIQDLQNEAKGPLHIGASYTYGEYILPEKIARLMEQHPAVSPKVSISNSASIIRGINSHELDIGIIEDEERDRYKGLNSTRLIEDNMYIIGRKDTPDKLDPQSLASSTWIVREEGSGTRSYQDQLFNLLDINPHTITLSSTQAVKNSVSHGLGLTLLSIHTVAGELDTDKLKIINADTVELSRYFHLLTPEAVFHPKSTRSFLDLLNIDSIETHHIP
ncbi:LysR family transcriptional regulator [Salinicoccus albus]|uniref:LysR family transcriptional regulator n=1 Tax=Salinicoccus albus TaxID=418756 RepID=UPI000372FB1B|nr:LysR family transcriptional regulator [Salinicoccus albus]